MTTLMMWEMWENMITKEGLNVLITGMIVTKMIKLQIKNLTTIERPWPID